MTIREALRELDLWGAGASFTLTDYVGSGGVTIKLIKDWKDMVNQVGREETHVQLFLAKPAKIVGWFVLVVLLKMIL